MPSNIKLKMISNCIILNYILVTHDGLSWDRGTTLSLNYSVSVIHTKVLMFIISVFFLSSIMHVNHDEYLQECFRVDHEFWPTGTRCCDDR